MKILEFDFAYYGPVLKSLRLDARMTQAQLAKKVNLTQGTIAAYEKSYQSPNMGRLMDICRALGVDEVRINTSRRTK